jgi:hypothetical protein
MTDGLLAPALTVQLDNSAVAYARSSVDSLAYGARSKMRKMSLDTSRLG